MTSVLTSRISAASKWSRRRASARIAAAMAMALAAWGCGGSEVNDQPSASGCSDSASVVRVLAERLPLVAPDLGPFTIGPWKLQPQEIFLAWRPPPDPKTWPPPDVDTRSPAVVWAPDSSAFAHLECCAGDVDAYIVVYFFAADTVSALSDGFFGPSIEVLDLHWCDPHTLLTVSRDTFDDRIWISALELRGPAPGGALELLGGSAEIRYEGSAPSVSALYESIWAYHRKTGRVPPDW